MEEHLNQAKHNEDFLKIVENANPDDYFDWKITIVFYVAIHYIDAYFASHGIRITSHEHRFDCLEMGEFCVSMEFFNHYSNLYNLARNARYNGFTRKDAFERNQKNRLSEAKFDMRFIKNYIIDDLDQITT